MKVLCEEAFAEKQRINFQVTYHNDSDTYICYTDKGKQPDPTEYGFIFERLVTRTEVDKHTIYDICNYYHFQLVKLVNEFNVLMIGEVDALHPQLNVSYVESGFKKDEFQKNRDYYKKFVYQMITNGSSHLLYDERMHCNWLLELCVFQVPIMCGIVNLDKYFVGTRKR